MRTETFTGASLGAALLLLASCAASTSAAPTPGAGEDGRAAVAAKLDAALVSEKAGARGGFVRRDAVGRVQVYAHVRVVDDASLARLRAAGLDVELANARLGIVQGWVAPADLERLAAEPVVTRVTPPSYGSSR